jgi:hypothetical protein
MSARLVVGSVTRERALEIREPSCMLRLARSFFISEVCGPVRAVRHVVPSEPS